MTTATANGSATSAEAQAWVEMFTEGWANPVDADTFCDHFEPHLQPEVRMIQPSMRPIVGKEAFREEFARPLFDIAYIELRLEGTVGRRPFTMHTCDRIKLRDGKAVERVAYLDATPLVKAVALSPRSWPKFLKMQLRSLRRPA